MARRPRSDAADEDLDHWRYPASLDVYEHAAAPAFTGLLDHHGTPIYRMPEPRRIGFRPL